jgi:hypothetical protein
MAAPGQYWHHVPVPISSATISRGTFWATTRVIAITKSEKSTDLFIGFGFG